MVDGEDKSAQWPHVETSGFWTPHEKEQSINVITVLKYARKSGGTASQWLQELALEIQEIAAQHNIQLQYQHIAGIKNIKVDCPSRKEKPLYERKLPKRFFKTIQGTWGPLQLDAFVTRKNTRLPRFWSQNPDLQAEATNAWNQRWMKTGLYLHPPWKFIPRVLRKLKSDRAKKTVFITPNWKSQYWWLMVLQQSLTMLITFKICKQWFLAAWLLSGNSNSKNKN